MTVAFIGATFLFLGFILGGCAVLLYVRGGNTSNVSSGAVVCSRLGVACANAPHRGGAA